MQSRMLLILFSWTVSFSCLAQTDPCHSPARITEILRKLPDDNHERHVALGEQVESNPDDFWINRLFLDGSVYERITIRERYKGRFDAHPSNLDDEYLYGRSLVGFSTPEALRIYADILAKNPNYPWVHYSLLEIYRSTAFRDRAKLRASFDTLARVCPAWIEPYQYLTALNDDALAPAAARLRMMLETTQDPRELRLYSTLWSAEFRVLPKAEGDTEKRRVEVDLKRLRGIGGVDATIVNGARLIIDAALVMEMSPVRKPDVGRLSNDWLRAHPRPAESVAPDKKRAYAEDLLKESEKWIAMAPDSIIGYSDRLRALIDLGAAAGEVSKALNDLLRIAKTGQSYSGFTFVMALARTCVENGVLLGRVPALIEEVLKKFDDPEAEIEIDLSPNAEMTRMNRMTFCSWHVSAVVTLSIYYQKIGRLEKARAVLAPLPSFLAAHSLPAGVQDLNAGHNLLVFYALANYSYWARLAELDEHEGQNEDALRDYREALLASYDQTLICSSNRAGCGRIWDVRMKHGRRGSIRFRSTSIITRLRSLSCRHIALFRRSL